MKRKSLAIILARSGSKGLPNKNICFLNKMPLIAYSIIAAKNSDEFTDVIVSTDSKRYAEIAKEYGASVPFLRSEKTAGDLSDKWETVREVLQNYSRIGKTYDDVCVLQPTSPLRTSEDIIKAYEIFDGQGADAVVSVCECEHPPTWAGRIDADGRMDDFNREEMYAQRQELGAYYRLNGAIFISKTEVVESKTRIYEKNCIAYIMPRERSVDIDSSMDLKIAEVLMRDLL